MTYLLTKSPESLSKNSYLCCVAEVDEGFKGVFGPGGGVMQECRGCRRICGIKAWGYVCVLGSGFRVWGLGGRCLQTNQ